jgi:carbon monoxide dehydrogenase subunit G
MRLENSCLIPAARSTVWNLIMDIPRSAACVPGLQEIVPDGEDKYRATMQSRVGPMKLTFSGTVAVLESDESKGEARIQVEASDRRVGGGIKADMKIRLVDQTPGHTELTITTDTAFMGKLGGIRPAPDAPQSQEHDGRVRPQLDGAHSEIHRLRSLPARSLPPGLALVDIQSPLAAPSPNPLSVYTPSVSLTTLPSGRPRKPVPLAVFKPT